jgi:Uma2 family endonuclease
MIASATPGDNLMVGAAFAPILSVASYRAWLGSRPDKEHWELIEGVPMMMTPPNRRHQRITSNLESLLNAALKRHNPALAAYHDIGVNIVSTVPYDPEPDVAVLREDEVAEVLSESDKGIIESKRTSTALTRPAPAFSWSVRIAWKSSWTVASAMVGARRCCRVPTSSPSPSSA